MPLLWSTFSCSQFGKFEEDDFSDCKSYEVLPNDTKNPINSLLLTCAESTFPNKTTKHNRQHRVPSDKTEITCQRNFANLFNPFFLPRCFQGMPRPPLPVASSHTARPVCPTSLGFAQMPSLNPVLPLARPSKTPTQGPTCQETLLRQSLPDASPIEEVEHP